jgi:very-short-patch-repair endonuclease
MPDERRVLRPYGVKNGAHPDRVVGDLAERQYGVAARRQLERGGVTPKMIERRVASGQLVRLHRGVYALGHRHLRREAFWLAAVLAAGEGAALSHRDAAALHGLLAPGGHRRVEVTTPRRTTSSDGIRVHRSSSLDASEVTTCHGIPVTSVARTLVDLAGTVSAERLKKALEEAERANALDLEALERSLAKTARRHGPGHRTLSEALAQLRAHGAIFTRSELEDRFLSLVVRRHALSTPVMNAWIGDMEVDALWREQRVVAELDGYASHFTRHAFQRDRERSNDLQAKGYHVLRFTYADVTRTPARTAARIAEALR